MNGQERTEAGIGSALASLESLLATESDETVSAIRGLEGQNKRAAERYGVMNKAAEGLLTDRVFLEENNGEIMRYVEQVNHLALEVERVEKLVEQMSEWSKELAVKVKRL